MGEMAAFINGFAKAKLPCCLIQFPSGKWGFVGSVPMELAYTGPADAIEDGRKYGFGLVKHRGVKTVAFDTEAEAEAAATALGVAFTRPVPAKA